IFGNVKTEVCCIRGTRSDQMDVHDRASGPGVALVDGIAVAIDLQRTIEVRSRFDGTFTVVLDFSAPEEYLAFFISRLQLEPDLEGVHRATWEKVADFAGTHDHVHAGVIAAAHGSVRAGKAMRMHESVHIAIVERRHSRHVAIGTVHGGLGIVEGARALSGYATSLPVIVFIEAANPAVTIYRDIQMDLMARRTELRSICAHEGL